MTFGVKIGIKPVVSDFGHLFFPRVCNGCDTALLAHEQYLCLQCLVTLPQTGYTAVPDNPVARLFWGRIALEGASAFLHFRKRGVVQRLMHQLKYHRQQEIGQWMGGLMGEDLRRLAAFANCDVVVPVPLHPDKLRIRGYNQSDPIARGTASALGASNGVGLLVRTVATSSQTRKGRFERWQNVGEAFKAAGNSLQGARVLLVDDVVTTGSTLEGCARAALNGGAAGVCVATLACA